MAEPDISPTALSGFIAQQQRNAFARTLPSPDDDPDKAARAQQLAGATGIDPSIVYSNLDDVESQFRNHLVSQMLQGSPEMQGYVNSHPLAAKVSGDDWGNLHNAWEATKKVAAQSPLAAGVKAYWDHMIKPTGEVGTDFLRGTWEGWSATQPLRMGEAMTTDPNLGKLLNVIMALDPGINKSFMAITHGGAVAAGSIYNKVTGTDKGDQFAENFEHALSDPALMASMPDIGMELNMVGNALSHNAMLRAQLTAQRVRPYASRGIEPPLGVDALVDHAKAGIAKIDMDALKEAFDAWKKTETRERSPEMAVMAARQVVGDTEISISGDAVRALYGDKVPAPDDGFLGWVPNIREQLEHADLFGVDVKVPLAGWLARTDPDVAKGLHDFIRVRRGGLTLDEAKNLPPIDLEEEAYPGTRFQQPTRQETTPPTANQVLDTPLESSSTDNPGTIVYTHRADDGRLKRTITRADGAVENHYLYEDDNGDTYWVDVNKNAPRRARPMQMDRANAEKWVRDVEKGDYKSQGEEGFFGPRFQQEEAQLPSNWNELTSEERANWEAQHVIPDLPRSPDIAAPERELREILDFGNERRQVPFARNLYEWDVLARQGGFSSRREAALAYSREHGEAHILYPDGNLSRAFRNGHQLYGDEFNALDNEYQQRAGLNEVFSEIPREVEQALDSTRRSAGIQRRTEKYTGPVTLAKRSGERYQGNDVHTLELRGENDALLGDMQVTYDPRHREVYVNGIAIHGYEYGESSGYNLLGHSAMRNVLRQLKQMFPEAENISGYRVGGGRQRAGKTGSVVMKFDESAAGFLHDLQERHPFRTDENGTWVDMEHGVIVRPKEVFDENAKAILSKVDAVFKKLAPKLLQNVGVEKITQTARPKNITGGLYQAYTDRLPFVMWAYDGGTKGDAVTVVRHEIIHHLRAYGFFKPEEWAVLRDAAIKENWLQKHDVMRRYRGQGLGTMIEEAIADEFAARQQAGAKWDGPVGKIFAKLHELWEGIRDAVKSALGREPTFEDIFNRVERGEVGAREAKPIHSDAYMPGPGEETRTAKLGTTKPETLVGEVNRRMARLEQKASQDEPELPGMTRMEDRDLFSGAAAVGTTKKTYSQLQRAIDAQDEADMKFIQKQIEKDVARRQTKEWKDAESKLRAEIRPNIENRPDIAADRFLREGVLYDEKVRGRPRLDSTKLNEEQKNALPKDYHTPGGIDPDDAAALFGYRSGDELVGRLAGLQVQRGNMGPKQFINHIVDAEVEQRMRLQHGDLAQNILDEVQEHVLSETEFNKLHEETLAGATRLGMEMSLTKEDVKAIAKDQFDRMIASKIDVEDFLRNALRAGDLSGRALLDNQATEAFKQLQRRMYNFLLAREMKQFEKVQRTLERLEAKYAKRTVSGVEPMYKDRIQELMSRFGMDVRRRPEDLQTEMAARGDTGTLKEFVDEVNGPFGALQLDDRLYDPAFNKKVNQMTTEEYRALSSGLKVLDKAGRDALKVLREGAEENKAELVGKMRDQMRENRDLVLPKNYRSSSARALMQKIKHMATVGILNPETWLNRFDKDNLHGLFNQWFVRPLTGSANREATLLREFSKKYRDLGQIENAQKKIRSPFNDPLSITEDDPHGQPYDNFTYENVAAMVSNVGNPYNREVMFKGLGMDEQTGMNWLAQNAPRALWERAEKLGKIFNEAFEEAQTVYRSIYGEAPEKIELKPFTVQLADGSTFQSEGWYHPVIRDEKRTNSVRKGTGEEMMEQERGLFPSIANGYTKRRTGKIDVLDLTHDMIPYKLTQILHDTAFRSEIVEAAKLVRDKDFRKTINQYAGQQYLKMIDNWLRDIAGAFNEADGTRQTAQRLSNMFRENTIGTLIGFNPSTVMKHGPTALVNSMYETGFKAFTKAFAQTALPHVRDAVTSIFTRDEGFQNRTLQFIWENSEEIRRRDRNWTESMGGARQQVEGKLSLRSRILQLGSKPVAFSDMISALPTWLAAYNEEIAAGGTHGDAVFAGDRAVRRAHGSTATTNLPQLMRKGGLSPWLTSLYGFFSTQMQRRAEIAFKANDTYKFVKQGELAKAAKEFKSMGPLVFASIIWPTLIEEWVASIGTDDHRTGLQKLAEGALQGLLSSVVLLRDLRPSIAGDHAPSVGILSTVAEDARNAFEIAKHPIKSFDRAHAAKSVQSLITAAGIGTGMAPTQVGRAIRYGMGLNQGIERGDRPFTGMMRGTEKLRVVK